MTAITGGLRVRLLRDSLYTLLSEGLNALGWFDPNRRHRPVHLYPEPADWDQPVEPNAISVSIETATPEHIETGSNLTRYSYRSVVDLFAEGEALGVELANDIRDLLRGRLGGLQSVPIYDFRSATPPILAYASVTDVEISRSLLASPKAWQRYWFTVACVLSDSYYLADE